MSRLFVLLVPTLGLLQACSLGPDGKAPFASGDDTGIPPEAPEDEDPRSPAGLSPVDTTMCDSVPAARRYAHAAWFFTDTPLERDTPYGTLPVERGFVLYGGTNNAESQAFDDLWLFDMTHLGVPDPSDPEHQVCPWVEIMSGGAGANGGTSFGAMVYRDGHDEFVLAGGFNHDGTGFVSTDDVQTLSLQDLAGGFALEGSGLSSVDAVVVLSGGTTTCAAAGPTCWDSAATCNVDYVIPADRYANEWYLAEDCGDITVAGTYTGWWAGCADDPGALDPSGRAVVSAGALSGRAEISAIYDPVADSMKVFGGTAGCEGADCTEAQGTLARGDVLVTPDRHLWVSDDTIAISSSGGVSRDAGTFALLQPDSWPDGSSMGLRWTGAARLGVSWDLAGREFDATEALSVVVGGSTHQTASASHNFALDPAGSVYLNNCQPDFPTYNSSYWTGYHPQADTTDGLVEEGLNILIDDGSGNFEPLNTDSDLLPRVGPAVATIDAERILIAGGQDGSGALEDIYILDTNDSPASLDYQGDLQTARGGAAIAYDPVTGRAFLFGGHATDTGLDLVEFDPTLEAGATSSFDMDLVVTVETTDAVDWTIGADILVEHSCSAAGCFTDYIDLAFSTDDLTALESATVSVQYADSSVVFEPLSSLETRDEGVSIGRLHLSRILADGDAVQLQVSFPAEAVETTEPAWGTVGGTVTRVPRGERSAPSFGYMISGVPVWVAEWADPAAAWKELAYIDYDVDVPLSLTVLGPGSYDSTEPYGSVYLTGEIASRMDMSVLYVMEDMTRYTAITAVDGTTYTVFVDEVLESASRTATEAVIDGTHGTVDGVQTVVEEVAMRLGAAPNPAQSLVFVRAYEPDGADDENTLLLGEHTAGVSLVYTKWGGTLYGGARTLSGTIAHETTHIWFGEALRTTPETRWIKEALASLMDWTVVPVHGQDEQLTAIQKLEWSMNSGSSTGLVYDSGTRPGWIDYNVGPYVLNQFQWLQLAHDPINANFWGDWSDWRASQDYGAEVTEADLEAFIEGFVPYFYIDWVADFRVGAPLVAIDDLDFDSAAGTGSVTIAQVQRQVYGTSVSMFTEAPYVFACSPFGAPTTTAFAECGATVNGTLGVTSPYAYVGATKTFSLANGSGVSAGGALPAIADAMATIQLGADATLKPLAGLSIRATRRPWLHCEAVAVAGVCGQDGDGDGFPALADCNDGGGGASVHPYQVPAAGAELSVDVDCDGWRQ